MIRRARRNHTPLSRRRVALAAVKATEHGSTGGAVDVHPNQITSWKAQRKSGAADVFWPSPR